MTFRDFLINLSLGGAVHKMTFFDLRNRLDLFVLRLFKKKLSKFLLRIWRYKRFCGGTTLHCLYW